MLYPIIKRKRIERGPARLLSRRVEPLVTLPEGFEPSELTPPAEKKAVRGKPFPVKPKR